MTLSIFILVLLCVCLLFIPLSSLLCSHVQLTHGPIALMDHQTDVLGPGGAGERRREPLRLQPKPVGGVMEPKTLSVVESGWSQVHREQGSQTGRVLWMAWPLAELR